MIIFFFKGGEELESGEIALKTELLMVLRLIRLKIIFMILNVCLRY